MAYKRVSLKHTQHIQVEPAPPARKPSFCERLSNRITSCVNRVFSNMRFAFTALSTGFLVASTEVRAVPLYTMMHPAVFAIMSPLLSGELTVRNYFQYLVASGVGTLCGLSSHIISGQPVLTVHEVAKLVFSGIAHQSKNNAQFLFFVGSALFFYNQFKEIVLIKCAQQEETRTT